MPPILTVFERSPDRGRGLARDMRVRWALEEAGQRYEVRTVSFEAMKQAPHRARNPFGQIPSFEDGDLVLFESGAIVLHLARRHAGLLPVESVARERAVMWMFAALNTVEPPIVEREAAGYSERDRPWQAEHLAMLDARVRVRLDELSRHLAGRDWLERDFSAGDLLMVSVLQRLGGTGLLDHTPALLDYIARGTARPAYRRAFDAQRAQFERATVP
jgi:glutathione S-transferase